MSNSTVFNDVQHIGHGEVWDNYYSVYTSFSLHFIFIHLFFLLSESNPVNNVYLKQNLKSAIYKVNVCIAK